MGDLTKALKAAIKGRRSPNTCNRCGGSGDRFVYEKQGRTRIDTFSWGERNKDWKATGATVECSGCGGTGIKEG